MESRYDPAELERVANKFKHHPPKSLAQVGRHEAVREAVGELAYEWQQILPDSDEKDEAIKHLQTAMMFANSAIAQFGED